jgi:hypothetical protein
MLRDVEFYEDSAGYSEVQVSLRSIARNDPRHLRHIQNKIRLLQQQEFDDALESKLIKKPTPTIYILRVKGSGGFEYRLPFFEPQCKGGRLIVFTHCEKRVLLRGARYQKMIEEAEQLRLDWIARNCQGN